MKKTAILLLSSILMIFAVIGFSVFQTASAVTVECPTISNWQLNSDIINNEYWSKLTCNYLSSSGWNYITANMAIHPDAALGISGCSGDWDTSYYGGQIYSSSHNLNVKYEYNSDVDKNSVVSAAQSLLKQLESNDVAISCSAKKPVCSDPQYPYYNSATDRCYSNPCFDPEYPHHNPKTNKCYSTSQSPYDWNELGNELLDKEKYTEALSAYEKAISLDNNYKWAWYNKGLALTNLEKYGNALSAFNQALRLDPTYENANFKKGYALSKLERPEEAVSAYLKELQLNPNHKWTLNNLGWELNELGRYHEALSYLERSLKIDPANILAQENKDYALAKLQEQEDSKAEYDSWVQQGRKHLDTGNYYEAIRNFDLAYKVNPNDQNLINLKAEALKQIGLALVDQEKFDLAVVFLGESNHLKPDGFVKSSQNNAFNRWSEKIKSEIKFIDPNINDKFQFVGQSAYYPSLPTVGKALSNDAIIYRLTKPGAPLFDPSSGESISGTELNVGDIISVPSYAPPFVIDWGYATTTVKPNSVFLIGRSDHLETFAKTNPHYLELVEGQLRLYKDEIYEQPQEEICFEVKTDKNLSRMCGTDVTISHDKTTNVSSIQVDHGTVQIYDVKTDSIKEFGSGSKLVTNNDGYYVLAQEIEQPGSDASPSTNGGGCLIATAAYGTEMAPQVQFLREIRDNTVMSTMSGASFMTGFNQLYYSFSPTIADLERENPMFQEVVRAFITPMISTLSIMTLAEDGSEVEVLGLGISVIALNLTMYIAAPALIGFKIHKHFKSRKI